MRVLLDLVEIRLRWLLLPSGITLYVPAVGPLSPCKNGKESEERQCRVRGPSQGREECGNEHGATLSGSQGTHVRVQSALGDSLCAIDVRIAHFNSHKRKGAKRHEALLSAQ